jgi:uncharacterized protein (DUF433 family)
VTRIVRTPGVCGGSPYIEGTRLSVWVIEQSIRAGASRRELFAQYPTLKEAGLQAVREYVAEHTAEIDREIAENTDGTEAWRLAQIRDAAGPLEHLLQHLPFEDMDSDAQDIALAMDPGAMELGVTVGQLRALLARIHDNANLHVPRETKVTDP